MKRFFLSFSLVFLVFLLLPITTTLAQQSSTEIPYQLCGVCPPELETIYQTKGEQCATDFDTFKANPKTSHFWVEDPEITAQGKANDRARQFIYWVMTNSAIDNHPVLYQIWGTTRNLAYFLTILTAALLGLGIIIGQRTNFDTGVKLWPAVTRILMSLLFISFSASLVITIIQLSEILMKFFIENLGGKDLFNIYFSGISQEKNYLDFVGCRDLNFRVQEAVKTELFLLKLTNISYYLMGGMLLLRKIVLWFLLFVSPFLAILMAFSFIKNVGWIWIGVFFQWVFYGPLLALFLGAVATVWKVGLPFVFDFSRTDTAQGYIYPTAINILYGGPAQKLSALNNGNYIDTFAEYIITLLMLWAVIIFPWWLLRNFRDYCCEGINAIKNLLLSSFNPARPGGPSPSPVAPSLISNFGAVREIPIKVKLETVEEIKKAKTEEIVRSLDMRASKITDVAHFETNKTLSETVTKNINYLKNPTQATTTNEKLHYMNIRTEIANRATKADPVARQFLGSIITPKFEMTSQKQNILKTIPKTVPITQVISIKVKLPQEKVQLISSSVSQYVSTNIKLTNDIFQKTGVAIEKVQQVLNLLAQKINSPINQIVDQISQETKIDKEKVSTIIKEFGLIVKTDSQLTEEVAKKQGVDKKEVEQVISAQAPLIAEPEKNIEQTVIVPSTVSIDEYEQVKKMWINHYEKGEIPVTENIKTRNQWVDQDITLIINTLNKLLSDKEEMKQQGLDEVGFILPIFMVNNLDGEQLITYLKAKVEAAKQVKELGEKEKEITQKLKAKSEEELIDVFKPKKKEAGKTMEMKEELKIEN